MKTVAITGAGNGIGRALALHYAGLGWGIIGIDRDEEALEETRGQAKRAGAQFRAAVADLGLQRDRQRVLGIIDRRSGVDLFIHNAAINLVGPFENLPLKDQKTLIHLNLVAPMILTRHLLANNLLRKKASLVFMGSLSSFVGYPGAAVYAGAKDGLAHYARSLRIALKPRGVHVLTVYPGPSRTRMAERCSPAAGGAERKRMPPEQVARLIARAVERRRAELIPGFKNRLFAQVGQWLPRLADWTMKRAIYDRLDRQRHPAGLRSGPP